MRHTTSFVWLILATALASGCGPPEPPQIAITLDDAPLMHRAAYPDQSQRILAVDSLISALVSRGVPATAFAIGQDAQTDEDAMLLARWAQAGIGLGNHSFSHRSFDEMDLEEATNEIVSTRGAIARAGGPAALAPYFRFPFLEEGESPEKRRQWRDLLSSLGLGVARVTITTDDWRYDARYTEAEIAEDWDARYQVGQEYLAHVLESVRFWDGVADELYERPVRHVLMLHANRINRDYLGGILDALIEEGFEFVPLSVAYDDPMFSEQVAWTSTNGMSYLEHIKQDRLQNGTYPAP